MRRRVKLLLIFVIIVVSDNYVSDIDSQIVKYNPFDTFLLFTHYYYNFFPVGMENLYVFLKFK